MTANEEEIIALSIAISYVCLKNMSTLIQKLFLKTKDKDKEIKIILIISLTWKPHRSSTNMTFLKSLKTQEPDIQKAIDYALESLKE